MADSPFTLEQREVDIKPGQPLQRIERQKDQVGLGTAKVSIANESDQERDHELAISVESSWFKREWVKMNPLPPRKPTTQKDRESDQMRRLILPISEGDVRNVYVEFNVPAVPSSRAGVYPLTLTGRHFGRNVKLSQQTDYRNTILAIVRPFYNWEVRYRAEKTLKEDETLTKTTGRFLRRKARFTLEIVNRGNDWLYVEVAAQKNQFVSVLVPNAAANERLRLAIPPPEEGSEKSFRSFEVVVTTKHKEIRGDRKVYPLPLQFARADAPTVPPLDKNAMTLVVPAGIDKAVELEDPNDAKLPTAMDLPNVAYRPLIPATWTGFVQMFAGKARSIIFGVLGLLLAAQLMSTMVFAMLSKSLTTNTSEVTSSKGYIRFETFPWLVGFCGVDITGPDGKKETVRTKPFVVDKENHVVTKGDKGLLNASPVSLYGIPMTETVEGGQTFWDKYQGQKVLISGRLMPWPIDIPWFPGKGTYCQIGKAKMQSQSLALAKQTWEPKDPGSSTTVSVQTGEFPPMDDKAVVEPPYFTVAPGKDPTEMKLTLVAKPDDIKKEGEEVSVTWHNGSNKAQFTIRVLGSKTDLPPQPVTDASTNGTIDPATGAPIRGAATAGAPAGSSDGGTATRAGGSGENPAALQGATSWRTVASKADSPAIKAISLFESGNSEAAMAEVDKCASTPELKALKDADSASGKAFADALGKLSDDATTVIEVLAIARYHQYLAGPNYKGTTADEKAKHKEVGAALYTTEEQAAVLKDYPLLANLVKSGKEKLGG